MSDKRANSAYVKMFLIFAVVSKTIEVIIYHAADLSIWGNLYAAPAGIPLPVRPEYNPEGLLWLLLNPFQWGIVAYAVYTFLFDMGMLGLQMILVRKGKLPIELVAFNQVCSLVWYWGWGREVQNITVTSFLPLMYLLPELGLFAILQKFPIGYYPIIDNPHVDCLLHCAFGNLGLLYTFRAINYVVLLAMFFDPLLRRHNEGEGWFPFLRLLKH